MVNLWINPIFYIRNINQLQRAIFQSYEQEKYTEVIRLSETLIKEYRFENEYLHLNMAHSYFLMQNFSKAIEHYNLALQTNKPNLQATALLQLAVIAENEGNIEDALQLLKKAILIYPANAIARYNYELLKKRINSDASLPERPSQINRNGRTTKLLANALQKVNTQLQKKMTLQANLQGKEQTDKQANQGKKDKEQVNKSLKINKLRQINLDIDKANQILEAMRNHEVQYLQQRKYTATPPPQGKPLW